MKQMIVFFTLAAVVVELHAAPQFITFKDGKLGVNFGGYHAAVGVGGGNGLFAEAGTPFGQQASAGLGGSMGGNGQSAGGLFAGATAGNGIKAQAGLGGTLNGQNSMSGGGFASAQYGNRIASAGLGGETNENGAVGVKYAGTNIDAPIVVKETTVEKVHKNLDEAATADFVPLRDSVGSNVNINTRSNAEVPVFTKEVHSEPATQFVEKHKVYYKHKPHHHFVKTIGYYDAPAQRRVDSNVESSVNVEAIGERGVHSNAGGAGDLGYTKQVTVQRNPQFFADIFNIPISTLKAVSNFLGNSAANTNVSVQKTASVHSDAEISSKHAPQTSASSASSETQFTVQTPQAASFIEDIFAIPINTLGAVNKFLENNVPARKRIQVDGDTSAAVRAGPAARRRAAKRVIILQENSDKHTQDSE